MTQHQGRVVQTIFRLTESLVKDVGTFEQLVPDGYWSYKLIYFRKVEKSLKKEYLLLHKMGKQLPKSGISTYTSVKKKSLVGGTHLSKHEI